MKAHKCGCIKLSEAVLVAVEKGVLLAFPYVCLRKN